MQVSHCYWNPDTGEQHLVFFHLVGLQSGFVAEALKASKISTTFCCRKRETLENSPLQAVAWWQRVAEGKEIFPSLYLVIFRGGKQIAHHIRLKFRHKTQQEEKKSKRSNSSLLWLISPNLNPALILLLRPSTIPKAGADQGMTFSTAPPDWPISNRVLNWFIIHLQFSIINQQNPKIAFDGFCHHPTQKKAFNWLGAFLANNLFWHFWRRRVISLFLQLGSFGWVFFRVKAQSWIGC